MGLYRAYDIRGIYGEELTDDVAVKIGKAFASTVPGRLAVGYDARVSSPSLSRSMIEGLTSAGADVVDVGMVPTPVLYFTIHKLGLDGGVMVTGSHNPPEYNGFKLCRGTMTLYGPEIQDIGAKADKGDFMEGDGKVESYDIIPEYLDFLRDRIRLKRKLKVVVDSANGTAGPVAPQLFRSLGCEVVELYSDPDGNFPNHPADPTVDENMSDLIRMVKSKKADIGVGYDGDSDRAGFVTEDGSIIRGDQAIILFSRDILKKYPGSPIIFEVKCSQAVSEDVEANGGRPVMYRTGHSFIKKKIKEEGAKLAGEMSGHFFFADDYPGYDDGIYASARMVQIISNSPGSFGDIVSTIPKYYSTPEIRVDCPDELKFDIVGEITEHFKGSYDTITVDGVRVEFGDGWGLVRASNTQPAVILRFEAKTPARLEEIMSLFREVVDSYPELRGKL
ncbi:MAG: phosphomannomutase/phosphoglucomutase [Candidatus Altiarchaeota archaeon]